MAVRHQHARVVDYLSYPYFLRRSMYGRVSAQTNSHRCVLRLRRKPPMIRTRHQAPAVAY